MRTAYASEAFQPEMDSVLQHIDMIENAIISGEIPSSAPQEINWADGVIRCIDAYSCERDWTDAKRLLDECIETANTYGSTAALAIFL